MNAAVVDPVCNNARIIGALVLRYYMYVLLRGLSAVNLVFTKPRKAKQIKAKMCNGRRHVPLCPACAN